MDNPETNVTTVITNLDLPRLCNVEYPGIVENPASAIRTLGGPIRISEAFSHPSRKLELKYRPGDVFSNHINGTGRTTCGLLLSVRRKRKRDGEYDPTSTTVNLISPPLQQQHVNNMKSSQTNLIDLDESDQDQENNDQKFSSLMDIQPDDIKISDEMIPEESSCDSQGTKVVNVFKRKILKEETKILQHQLEETVRNPGIEKLVPNNLKCQQPKIEIPRGKFRIQENKNIEVEALGVVNKLFSFDGLSNFQYLPIVRAENDGEYKSIANDIFPTFGDPEHGELYETVKMETGERDSFPFCTPFMLSKIDTPVPWPFNNNQPVPQNINDTVLVIEEDGISSTRHRRSVYTSTISFNGNEIVKIPTKALPQAVEDATGKFLTGEKLNKVKELFEGRPMWSKIALEWETKYTADQLKYILPCVAYFSLNGPWRSLWIKFGYDPRKDKGAFIYQLIDYRVPFEHRTHQVIDQADEESYHKFNPDKIPPKSQMFYQFCDIQIPEIQKLASALSVRLHDPDQMIYNPTSGFLDKDIMEFCRYCMSRCIEVRLHSLGKIKTIKVPAISLETGDVIPVDQLYVRPRRKPKKRFRSATNSKKTAKVMLQKKTPLEPLHNLVDLFEDDEEAEKEDDNFQEIDYDVSVQELVRLALNEVEEEEVKRRPSRIRSILGPSESSRDSFSDDSNPLYIPDEFDESSD